MREVFRPTRWIFLPVFVLVAELALGCGVIRFGELDAPPGRYVVTDVTIAGNQAVGDGDIEDGLATHTKTFAFDEAPLLDAELFADDIARIVATYARAGYFSSAAEIELTERPGDADAVEVKFRVAEGPPTQVARVELEGLESIPMEPPDNADERTVLLAKVKRKLESHMTLDMGDVWTEEEWDLSLTSIEDDLRSRGFLYARVLGNVYVERAPKARLPRDEVDSALEPGPEPTSGAVLVVQIAPGPLVRAEGVDVTGSEKIAASRVERRIDIEPGDIVTPDKLRRIEEQIFDLGAYAFVRGEVIGPSVEERLAGAPVTYDALRTVEWPSRYRVRFHVQEKAMQNIRAGAGAAFDNERSDAHLVAGYKGHNIGGLRHLTVQGELGWSFLPIFWEFERDGLVGEVSILYREPGVIFEYLDILGETRYQHSIDYGYQLDRIEANPSLVWTIIHRLKLQFGYSIEYFVYSDLAETFEAPSQQSLGFVFRDEYVIGAFEQTLSWDSRDNPLDPTKGVFASLSLAESFFFDFDYVRAIADVRLYATPLRKGTEMTIATRLRGGIVQDLSDEIPLTARFRAGGPSDMRGFGAGRMGPISCVRDGATTELVSDEAFCPGGADERVYVGGNVLLEWSGELRFRWMGDGGWGIGAAAFVDVGELWNLVEDVDLRDLNVAVGPGVLGLLPFGVARLDVGVPLLGGDPTEPVVHFSLGTSF